MERLERGVVGGLLPLLDFVLVALGARIGAKHRSRIAANEPNVDIEVRVCVGSGVDRFSGQRTGSQ